jgi:hypothetical protein
MSKNCKLCLEQKNLQNSHIIPEFFYKPLYDEKHRIHVLSTTPEEKNVMEQKGVREKLLCYDCEQYFSQLEDYARKVFYGGVEIGMRNDKNKILFEDIDYTKFKLFQLSLLWRASVSTVRLFSEVSIGAHEEKLRKMLINKNPGEYYEYGCSIIGLLMEGKRLADQMILKPESLRVDGQRFKNIRKALVGQTFRFANWKRTGKMPVLPFVCKAKSLALHFKSSGELSPVFLNIDLSGFGDGCRVPADG